MYGIDDETWLVHLRRGDYSRWFRDRIDDADLAAEAAEIEWQTRLSPAEGRDRLKAMVERRYTAPP